MTRTIKANIHFPGDPAVGLFSYGYTAEVPDDDTDPEYREFVRDELKKFYEAIDGEGRCQVWFEDEKFY